MAKRSIYKVVKTFRNDYSVQNDRHSKWKETFEYYLFGIRIMTRVHDGVEKHHGKQPMGFKKD